MPPDDDGENAKDTKGKGKARESMYVSLVEGTSTKKNMTASILCSFKSQGMVRNVLEGETFLFSEEELAFFTAYSTLSCT